MSYKDDFQFIYCHLSHLGSDTRYFRRADGLDLAVGTEDGRVLARGFLAAEEFADGFSGTVRSRLIVLHRDEER